MSTDTAGAKDKPKPDKTTITVTVFAINSTDGTSFTWEKTMKVRDAAAAVATAFGITDENATLSEDGTALDRDKTLVAAKIDDGDKLDLVSTGGGV